MDIHRIIIIIIIILSLNPNYRYRILSTPNFREVFWFWSK